MSEIIDENLFNKLKDILEAIRTHLTCMSDVVNYVDIFLKDEIQFEKEAEEILAKEECKVILKALLEILKKECLSLKH